MAGAATDIGELERELYGVPLDRFVDRRTELARELRARGERQLAADVARLRKPPVTVWALNQLARTHEPQVRLMLQTADQLQSTHDAGALRALADRYGAVVDQLAGAAAAALRDAGSAVTGERQVELSVALRAIATSPQREAFREGRLHELPSPDNDEDDAGDTDGAGTSMWEAAAQVAPPRGRTGATPAAAARRQRERQVEQLKRTRAQLEHQVEAAEQEAQRARERLAEVDQRLAELRSAKP